MPWNKIPTVNKCCGCIPDLKTAVTIIAVLGIVTSPAVSWAVVRHAYMIRVSCIITANDGRPDVVDVNLNNVLSFGFAANAGIGQSCLGPHKVASNKSLVIAVKYFGWVALLFDLLFLFSSINLLIKMQKGNVGTPTKLFMIAVTSSITLSFIYAMLYVSACLQIGGSFPVFEFIFAFVDMGIIIMWIYFLIVLRSYLIMPDGPNTETYSSSYFPYFIWNFGNWNWTFGNLYIYLFEQLAWLASFIYDVWIYFLIVVRSYRHQNVNYPTSPLSPITQLIQRVSEVPTMPSTPITGDLPTAPRTNGMTFHTHTME